MVGRKWSRRVEPEQQHGCTGQVCDGNRGMGELELVDGARTDKGRRAGGFA